MANAIKKILITGASGYLGSNLLSELYSQKEALKIQLVAHDIRPPHQKLTGVEYLQMDIRDPQLQNEIGKHKIDCIVHLAAVVSPGKNSNRQLEYEIDVEGTKNVLDGCIQHGVKKIIVTSSGAAYGYHSDNPEWLTEKHQLKGNQEYAYSWHKKLVEEMMGEYKKNHPQLQQIVLRVATILGKNTQNRITKLFDRKTMFTIASSKCPFVFIWDKDLVQCLIYSIFTDKQGTFNAAGDGALNIYELAKIQGKKIIDIPRWLMKTILRIAKTIKLSESGPEATVFVEYRPVLLNTALKVDFGFIPKKTSRQAFEYYLKYRKIENSI